MKTNCLYLSNGVQLHYKNMSDEANEFVNGMKQSLIISYASTVSFALLLVSKRLTEELKVFFQTYLLTS